MSTDLRRDLSGRSAAVTQRLVEAAVEEIRAHGYEGLTVRKVAARAGVAPATAYTYFSSKDHLVAEVFWRRLEELGEPLIDLWLLPAGRVRAALDDVGLLVAHEPRLAAACTAALLSADPDVARLRRRIGEALHRRLLHAAPDADPAAIGTLDLVLQGALLQAGVGHLEYTAVAERVAVAAELVLR